MNVHQVARWIACWQVVAEIPAAHQNLDVPVFKDTAATLASSKAMIEAGKREQNSFTSRQSLRPALSQ